MWSFLVYKTTFMATARVRHGAYDRIEELVRGFVEGELVHTADVALLYKNVVEHLAVELAVELLRLGPQRPNHVRRSARSLGLPIGG